MQSGFASWIIFNTAFEPLRLSVVWALLLSVDSQRFGSRLVITKFGPNPRLRNLFLYCVPVQTGIQT